MNTANTDAFICLTETDREWRVWKGGDTISGSTESTLITFCARNEVERNETE